MMSLKPHIDDLVMKLRKNNRKIYINLIFSFNQCNRNIVEISTVFLLKTIIALLYFVLIFYL